MKTSNKLPAHQAELEELDEDFVETHSIDIISEYGSEPSQLESRSVHEDIDNLDKLMLGSKEDEVKSMEATINKKPVPSVIQRQELVDDFIRNFFQKHGMNRSLEMFQKEWYDNSQKGKVKSGQQEVVSDIQMKNKYLEEKIMELKGELNQANLTAENAKATWDKLKKEKEYHQSHHKRVQDEKTKLFGDIEKLKILHKDYSDKYSQLNSKYEAAMKEKMLVKMERDRYLKSVNELNKTSKKLEKQYLSEDEDDEPKDKKLDDLKRITGKTTSNDEGDKTKKPISKIPRNDFNNPYLTTNFDAFPSKNLNMNKNIKAHNSVITALVVHPRKPFFATGSEDLTWKIWSVPNGEMIMQGEGHKDWISGLDFNPSGTHLATCSGDSTIKVWDFIKVKCAATFKSHTHPVSSISYHHTGDFLVSGNMSLIKDRWTRVAGCLT